MEAWEGVVEDRLAEGVGVAKGLALLVGSGNDEHVEVGIEGELVKEIEDEPAFVGSGDTTDAARYEKIDVGHVESILEKNALDEDCSTVEVKEAFLKIGEHPFEDRGEENARKKKNTLSPSLGTIGVNVDAS